MSSQRLRSLIRKHGLTPVGKAHIFMDKSGQPVVVREHVSRSKFRGDEMGGAFNVFSPDYMGDDDFGDEESGFFGTDLSYMGDDDFGDDELGAMMRRGGRNRGGGFRRRSEGSVADGIAQRPGLFPNLRRRRGGGGGGRDLQQTVIYDAQQDTDMNSHVNVAGAVPQGWCNTIVNGRESLAAAGTIQVRIRLQHDFMAQDVTFDGSQAGAQVSSIFYGDRLVWGSGTSVPITIFAATGFIRNLMNGQRLQAGLDIIVNGSLTAAGDLVATFTGMKPYATPMAG